MMSVFKKIKPFLMISLLVVLAIVGFNYLSSSPRSEQVVYESTYDLSKEYLRLRQQTDHLLINAESYADYATWDTDMTALLLDWQVFEEQVALLATQAEQEADKTALNINLVGSVRAYTAQEINAIYDKAPKFKGIATLAKHLGVDAKRAQLILNQAQDETSAEVFVEEGDAFENLEHQAIVIKDGCKVAGFVGGVVLTGGAAGLATAGVMTQATVVVTGVDLALEVTGDGAQIAFGDKNKISTFVGDVRTVTEPIASVLNITNVGSNVDKFETVMVGLEQFRATAQEGKVIGIDLTNFEYHRPFERIRQAQYPGAVSAAQMEKDEVENWLASLNKKYEPMTEAEIKDFLASQKNQVQEQTKEAEPESDQSDKQVEEGDQSGKDDDSESNSQGQQSQITGVTWKGTLESVSGGNQKHQSTEFEFILNSDGTVSGDNFKTWRQEGNLVKLFGEDEKLGHYEFTANGNSLSLSKIVIGDELIIPGEEYMGGVAPAGSLSQQASSTHAEPASSKISMSFSEYEELNDDGQLKNIALVEKHLGEPDVKTTDDRGRIVYVYFDLIQYESGNVGSVKMAFYNEEDYKSYITGMGASWDSNKENWDESGGGIRATSEVKNGDTLKKMYAE